MGIKTKQRVFLTSEDTSPIVQFPQINNDVLTAEDILLPEIPDTPVGDETVVDEREKLEALIAEMMKPVDEAQEEINRLRDTVRDLVDEQRAMAQTYGGNDWFQNGWEDNFRNAGLDPDRYKHLLDRKNDLMKEVMDLEAKRDKMERETFPHRVELAKLYRQDFIGKVVNLDQGGYSNIQNPNNPFAVAPAFFSRTSKSKHPEAHKWKFATIHPTGTVIKAKTKKDLTALTTLMDRVAPLMKDMGITLPALYPNQEVRNAGGCCQSSIGGSFGETKTPKVITLSTKWGGLEDTYNFIHELAHLEDDFGSMPKKKSWQPYYDYQKSLHDDHFKERFGRYLDYYIETSASPEEALNIVERAKQDTYAPPTWNRGDSDYMAVALTDDSGNGQSKVAYAKKKSSPLGEGWESYEIATEDLF